MTDLFNSITRSLSSLFSSSTVESDSNVVNEADVAATAVSSSHPHPSLFSPSTIDASYGEYLPESIDLTVQRMQHDVMYISISIDYLSVTHLRHEIRKEYARPGPNKAVIARFNLYYTTNSQPFVFKHIRENSDLQMYLRYMRDHPTSFIYIYENMTSEGESNENNDDMKTATGSVPSPDKSESNLKELISDVSANSNRMNEEKSTIHAPARGYHEARCENPMFTKPIEEYRISNSNGKMIFSPSSSSYSFESDSSTTSFDTSNSNEVEEEEENYDEDTHV